ncbi:hypothetical protein GWI33_023334 [Rhynchophorus ferrugineus]|uniref:Aquaporin-like protein n=1 Tax=Rhynchophorus ferrugineus TaxID=354439 RepID=A0A834MHD1_RHYFE|nr:hypothetical protein GWI33_023334 [Rhynchophorus ferrugineus]
MKSGGADGIEEIKEDKGKSKKKTKKKGDTTRSYVVNFASELLGTALLMFLGCMGCFAQMDNPPAVHHMSSLSFGLVVLVIIMIFGHVSGAHLNPAVTISTVIFRMLTPTMALVYIAGQFVGALLGLFLLKIVMPPEWVSDGFCLTKPFAQITPMQTLVIETIITAVLILVCCGVWDPRNSHKDDSVSLRFGLVVAAISMVAGPLSGASMNTARSFAPAFLAGDYQDQWIYWIGPNVGAVLACGIYTFLFAQEEEKNEEGTELEEVDGMITNKV